MITRSADALAAVLRDRLRGRVVLLGVGNPLRGDDGVGSYIARLLTHDLALRGASLKDAVVLDVEDIPESYIGPVVAARPNVVLIIDAAELNAPVGSAVMLGKEALQQRAVATHRTPLGPLATVLSHETDATILFLGIQPGSDRWGTRLSEEVNATAHWAADELAEILGAAPGAT